MELVGNRVKLLKKFPLVFSLERNCFLNWSNFPPEITATFLFSSRADISLAVFGDMADLLSVRVPSRSKMKSFLADRFLNIALDYLSNFFKFGLVDWFGIFAKKLYTDAFLVGAGKIRSAGCSGSLEEKSE